MKLEITVTPADNGYVIEWRQKDGGDWPAWRTLLFAIGPTPHAMPAQDAADWFARVLGELAPIASTTPGSTPPRKGMFEENHPPAHHPDAHHGAVLDVDPPPDDDYGRTPPADLQPGATPASTPLDTQPQLPQPEPTPTPKAHGGGSHDRRQSPGWGPGERGYHAREVE
jgi:hypothetical protein